MVDLRKASFSFEVPVRNALDVVWFDNLLQRTYM